jgi:gluconolactonase
MNKALPTFLLLAAALAVAAEDGQAPTNAPSASIDLMTAAGTGLVLGSWRYSDTRIIETDFKAPDTAGQPNGEPVRTYDYEPHAGGADFDDSAWQIITPESLTERRSTGRLCFNWYRIAVTIPERIGDFDPTGSDVVFETSVDDYAEVWVDGELPRAQGQSGGSVIKGWNAANRLVIGRHVHPGQRIQLAIFGINGPISGVPTNFIWMRTARLDFHPGSSVPFVVSPQEVNVEVERLDPDIDTIVPANPKIFKLAEGFSFIEGPVWARQGYLLFSDPNENRIYKYTPTGELAIFREQSGYAGADIGEYTQPGSNGLAFDRRGRLTIDEHGNRRVTRLELDGTVTVLADRDQGRRLNSPNDLVYRSDGMLYFTDPPFGLPKFFDDPRKELPYSGIYRVVGGHTDLLSSDMTGPNGIAFSPDEHYLYVGNWDPARKVVMRFPVRRDGSVGNGEVFFDMTSAPGEEAIDGIEVDTLGNLYVSGPGGVWIIAPDGRHLGTIKAPRLPANFAWGGVDGKTLYMTARSILYRMDLNVSGSRRVLVSEARP